MARYFLATNLPPRAEVLPDHDDSVDLAIEAMLDETERRRLQSYRAPTAIGDAELHVRPTVRWSQSELQELLAIARATIEPDDATYGELCSTAPPPQRPVRRVAVRRSEVVMTDVRARLSRGRDEG